MADININGITMEYSVIENMMDAETKAQILTQNPNYSEQEILDSYIELHREKYGKEFLQF